MKTPANLKKRIISGSVLIAAMICILAGDTYYEPYTPFLITFILIVGLLASKEISALFTSAPPDSRVLFASISWTIIATWFYLCLGGRGTKMDIASDPTFWVFAASFFLIASVAMLLNEILNYQDVGKSTARFAFSIMSLAYLGILPLFILKLRWLPLESRIPSTLALAATIFVPKLGDVGAYFTGSLFGKHKMAPTLSPKKTWEGFVGGMFVSILTAITFNFIGPEPLFKNGIPQAALFGLVVGLAGVVGDLFESMLKRDAGTKDASQSIPGFGGVLDVIDSVLFAAPVAYLFFVLA